MEEVGLCIMQSGTITPVRERVMFGMNPSQPAKEVFATVSGTLRDVLARARMEAMALGHHVIMPEHMLLALLSVDADVLTRAGIGAAAVRSGLHTMLRPAPASAPVPPPTRNGDLPYSSRCRKVIELAAREAQGAGRNVNAADVLIAIAAEGKNSGAVVLRELGVTADSLRALHVGAEVADGLLHLKIDEASDRSIFDQIVDGVQEAVATGRLTAGERLPSVRRLADRLDVAPGTVARAYGELERRGVVVTDGARGTRVAERSAVPSPAEALDGLLRPVVIAAFHMGATLRDLRDSLARVSRGILEPDPAD
jgi:GntR family transcriptional regulator